MNLHLGQVTKREMLPCGCSVNVRANGYDTIDPCVGHAVSDGIKELARILARIESDVRSRPRERRVVERARAPGILTRLWRRLF